MPATTGVKAPSIRSSKITYKSPLLHPLGRFVTEEAVAIMFGIDIDQIKRIDCYSHVVYVHANNVSRFVSYADFPPPSSVGTQFSQVFWRWLRRWRKHSSSKHAPEWWQNFYIQQIEKSFTDDDFIELRKVLTLIKSALSDDAWQQITQTIENVNIFVKIS
ncbi:hypothetical protein [Brunnivagina elsteri]|uniref:Uncharacterized protein n=1 Tax=Brunnivagina elsteri CCALA 953 TaxID=987040 RepID=A0A2A2TN41_9CYAN|nr:hypothetical protein [Calothrix elsteri]PAX59956.1 hypothetical protein CK510_04485 [Calothrix elsteri CCALA 953]